MQFTTHKTQFGNIGMSNISQAQADAQAYMMDFFNCRECENCWGCENCIRCTNCINCFDCTKCNKLKDGISKILVDALSIEQSSLLIANQQEFKIKDAANEYFSKNVGEGYKIPSGLKEAGLIPERYIVARCVVNKVFRRDKAGRSPSAQIKATLQRLVEMGGLSYVPPNEISKDLKFNGACYKQAEPL